MCRLCGSGASLKKSHIIPKFVGRWMKESSPTPYFRFGGDPDRRLQDLFTIELLCNDCENRFSAWETKFADKIFHPKDIGQTVFSYGPWLLRFAASLAWRAIHFLRSQGIEESRDLTSMVDGMETHLKRFLLGQVRNVESFTQHIYPMGELANSVTPGSPMLNRYLVHSVQIDILRSDDLSEMMLYIKIPMFMFFSVGKSKHRKLLETSRIKKSSLLQPKTYEITNHMLDYILEAADRMGQILDSMSPKSKAAADRALLNAIERDADRVAGSRLMKAMLADYEFYGEEATFFRD